MDWFEIIIWVVAIVIYIIAESTGRTGRFSIYNRPGRYGILGVEDFSLTFDPLADIRRSYDERLKIYYKYNRPKQYLINKDCEAKLVRISNSKMYFYCKERTNGRTAGRYFEVKGRVEHVATMWGIIDMEFSSYTRFQDVKNLYYSLNQGFETRGGLRYYNEPLFNKLPKAETNKSAQNEYCRMFIKTLESGEKVLYCSEIWGESDFDKPRMFMIHGDRAILYGILSEFSKERDKMQDYLQLLSKYAVYKGCKIVELNALKPEKEYVVKDKIDSPDFDENNLEPVKYLHVDFSDNKNVDNKNESEQNDVMPETRIDESHEILNQSIEKYDERNLDL